MKGLGARIQTMVDLYPVVDSIADIGCDHGYTAIALFEAGKAEKLFACDIGKEPLEMAKKNVRFRGLEDKISCRLGNGLEALEKGNVSTFFSPVWGDADDTDFGKANRGV